MQERTGNATKRHHLGMDPMRIMIALPDNHPYFHKEFVDSLTNIITDFYQWKIRTGNKHELSIVAKGSVCLDEARNSLVRLAIQNDQTHIFFMDTDQTFLPEAVRLMVECFENNPDVEAVTGIYTWKKPPFMPHLYGDSNGKTFFGAAKFPLNELFQVEAAGTGIVMIKTDVFRRTKQPWFKFEFNEDGSFKFGEDLFFFRKAKPLTICDPRNRSNHLKLESYGLDDYLEYNQINPVKDGDDIVGFDISEEKMEDIARQHKEVTKHQT